MLYVHNGFGGSFANLDVSHRTTRPNTAAFGTVVTAASGSKGSWAQIYASTVDATYGILLSINNSWVATAARFGVMDIGIGAAGSETVIIPDLVFGGANAYAAGHGGQIYYFPTYIPAGVRLAARAQMNDVSSGGTPSVSVTLLQRPKDPSSLKLIGAIEPVGLSVPGGTALGAMGTTTEGSWSLVGTTTHRAWWWQLGIHFPAGETAVTSAVVHVDMALGDASNKHVVIEDLILNTTSAEAMGRPVEMAGVEWAAPAGTNVYVRSQSSGASDSIAAVVYAGR